MERFATVFVLTLVSGMVLVPSSNATSDSDYSYSSATGYYVKSDGSQYIRSTESWYEWVPGSYGYGGYYSPVYRYVYTRAPYINPSAPNALELLAQIKRDQEAANAKLQLKAQEYNGFNEAAKTLGLNGQTLPRYAVPPALASGSGYGSTLLNGYNNPSVLTGNSLYGYSYSSVADVYSQTDLNVLYQQASKLAQNAQQLAGQATGDFSDLVKQEGGNRAAVAEILAKGQTAAVVLSAAVAAPRSRTETRTFTFQINPDGTTVIQPLPQGDGQPPQAMPRIEGNGNGQPPQAMPRIEGNGNGQGKQARWQAAAAYCVACHTGGEAKGKFQISAYGSLPLAQQMHVLSLLTTDDKTKMMPRKGDAAGDRVPASVIQSFVEMMSKN